MVAVNTRNHSSKKSAVQQQRDYLRNGQTNSLKHRSPPTMSNPPWEKDDTSAGDPNTDKPSTSKSGASREDADVIPLGTLI